LLVRLLVGGAAALGVWLWMAAGAMRQGRPWRTAFGWPKSLFALSVLGTGLFWWLARPAPVGAHALWGAALGLSLARNPTDSLPGLDVLLRWLMLIKFPLAEWNQLIFFDDYPTIYYGSVRGLQTLAQGGVFGWDTRLLGGYYAVSDVNHNLAFFLLPFVPFGAKIGYHLLIACSALAFPLLLALWVRRAFRESGATALGIWIAGFFFLTVMDNLLHWGMLNSFVGLDLLLVNLLLMERVRERRPWAIFPLALSLGLTVYAHVGFFLYSLAFLGLEFLRRPNRILARDLALAVLGGVVLSLPMTIQYLLYPGYFVESNESWAPQVLAWGEAAGQSWHNLLVYLDLNAWLALPVKYQALFLIALPAMILVVWRGGREARWNALCAALVAGVVVLELPGLTLALERLRFALPIFLTVAFVAWIWDGRAQAPRLASLLLLAALLWVAWPQRATWPVAHLPSLPSEAPTGRSTPIWKPSCLWRPTSGT